MTSAVIDQLLAGAGHYNGRKTLGQAPAVCHNDPAVRIFAKNYGNPAIGWEIAETYASANRRLPVVLTGDDQWVHRAALYLRYGKGDPAVAIAWYLGHDAADKRATQTARAEQSKMRASEVLKALLLVEGATIGDVAKLTGLDRDIVAAFERLFFNVLSRRDDALYIRDIVYPDGRIVELFDDYLRQEPIGKVLQRAGWNNGSEDVLFLAGLRRPELLHKMAGGADMAAKLEAIYMANGYITARNGWLNQGGAKGLNDARSLIAAAKAGGTSQQVTNPLHKAGSVLEKEIMGMATSIRRAQAQAKIEAYTAASK